MSTYTERLENKIEVIPPYSILQCRQETIVERDGEQIAVTYHRHTRVPGEDVSNDCPELQAIAAALWTDEVVTAYQASLANS